MFESDQLAFKRRLEETRKDEEFDDSIILQANLLYRILAMELPDTVIPWDVSLRGFPKAADVYEWGEK